jgi:hypothetical protein
MAGCARNEVTMWYARNFLAAAALLAAQVLSPAAARAQAFIGTWVDEEGDTHVYRSDGSLVIIVRSPGNRQFELRWEEVSPGVVRLTSPQQPAQAQTCRHEVAGERLTISGCPSISSRTGKVVETYTMERVR